MVSKLEKIVVLETGDKAPPLDIVDQDGKIANIADFKGKWLILYFYPKDDTPGCTIEAVDFTSQVDTFKKLNAEILGVSADTKESHCKFIDKHRLSIRLLSDTKKEVAKRYGIIKNQIRFGKEIEVIARSTFIIDPEGIIRKLWTNVKPKNHVEEVKDALQELKNAPLPD
jgi:peroxiredoxin Q/BCP